MEVSYYLRELVLCVNGIISFSLFVTVATFVIIGVIVKGKKNAEEEKQLKIPTFKSIFETDDDATISSDESENNERKKENEQKEQKLTNVLDSDCFYTDSESDGNDQFTGLHSNNNETISPQFFDTDLSTSKDHQEDVCLFESCNSEVLL